MRARTHVWTAMAALLAAVACAPGAPPAPTPEQVAEIAETTFPGAELAVHEVQPGEGGVRAHAELDGADVVLALERGDGAWTIVAVEQGERSYTIEQLQSFRASVQVLGAVADALGAYHEAQGEFPPLDDLVGLRELVPDYYRGDAGFADGWGNPLHYRVQGADYTLTSAGPDGTPSTEDDIILITGRFQGLE